MKQVCHHYQSLGVLYAVKDLKCGGASSNAPVIHSKYNITPLSSEEEKNKFTKLCFAVLSNQRNSTNNFPLSPKNNMPPLLVDKIMYIEKIKVCC